MDSLNDEQSANVKLRAAMLDPPSHDDIEASVRATKDAAPAYTHGGPYLLNAFKVANPDVVIDSAPRYWADEVQLLCQTVPAQWNAYEGVVYSKEGAVIGVKLDCEGGPRSILTANRFVTRITAPSGRTTNASGKKLIRKADSAFDTTRVENFKASVNTKLPVSAFLSRGCEDSGINFPTGMLLCPMERFRTTKVWPEVIAGCVVYQVEHELLHYDGIWWVSALERDAQLAAVDETAQIQKHLCSICGQHTREQIYQEMAICVNETCEKVGTDNGEAPENRPLTSHPSFLNRRVVPAADTLDPFPMVCTDEILEAIRAIDPKPIRISSIAARRTTPLRKTMDVAKKSKSIILRGIICEHCNRAVTRSEFAGWRCKTKGCNFYVKCSPPIEDLLAITEHREPIAAAEIGEVHCAFISIELVNDFPWYTITIFHLVQDCAIICAEPTEETLTAPGGPDHQWRSAIAEAVEGKRWLKRGINLKTDKLGGRRPITTTLRLE